MSTLWVEPNRETIPIRRADGVRPDLRLGCRFRDRRLHAFDRCTTEEPVLRNVAFNHRVACHLDL